MSYAADDDASFDLGNPGIPAHISSPINAHTTSRLRVWNSRTTLVGVAAWTDAAMP